LIVFALIAAAVAVSDQLLKAWVVTNYRLNEPTPILGDWLRIDFIHNAGGLFGLLQGSAPILAVVTLAVVVILVVLEAGSGWKSWLITLSLGLLLGGAVGNFIDRIVLGYVVDFADIGVGTWRFYVFNVADSAVTISILLMLVLWFVTPVIEGRAGSSSAESRTADGVDPSGSGNGPVVG
jgi:signal peptidase II